MIVHEYQKANLEEDHIDLYYRKKTKEIHSILEFLRKHQERLIGKDRDRDVIFSLDQVYYFESVDKKTYVYLQRMVLQMDIRLQDIEEAYREYGFIRINKSAIVNVYRIASLKPALNMRVLAILDNGECLQVNRSYKAQFHAFLKDYAKEGK